MSTIRTAIIEHAGDSDFVAMTGTGRRIEFGDAARGFLSPVETVLVALGSCSAMDVVSIAAKKRQAVDAYLIHVRGDQRDEYPQVFTEIEVVHEVTGRDLSEGAIRRSIELSATKYCPVNAMLSAGATEVHHGYRVTRPGEPTDEAEVPRLIDALIEVAANHAPFTIPTGGLGAFPSRRDVRILWYGLADRSRRLAELAIAVRIAVGCETASPFRAHLTLARAHGDRGVAVPPATWKVPMPAGQLAIEQVVLYRSHLGSGPASYENLATAPLGVTLAGSRASRARRLPVSGLRTSP